MMSNHKIKCSYKKLNLFSILISGNFVNDKQFLNIDFIYLTREVSHLDTSGIILNVNNL